MAIATPQQAIKFAQSLVQRGMPTPNGDSDEDNERFHRDVYEYVSTRCLNAPFMAYDNSTVTTRTWSQQKVCVEDAIGNLLPSDVYDKLKRRANLSDVQSVMDLHTFKDFSSNIFSHKIKDNKKLIDLIFMDDPGPTTSKLEIHYIRLTAEYDGRREYLFLRQEYRTLTAEYRRIVFSALTSVLQEVERRSRSDLADETQRWLLGNN